MVKPGEAGAVLKGRIVAVDDDPGMRKTLWQAVGEPHVSVFLVCEGAERVASQARQGQNVEVVALGR